MKIGIGSYTYPWAIGIPGYPCEGKKQGNKQSVLDLIKKASELGVQVVQICDNIPLHELSKAELKDIKKLAEELDIFIEVGTKGVETQHLIRYVEIAEFLNSKILRVILHKNDGVISTQEAFTLIEKVLPIFEEKKIKIAIENHEKHSTRELVNLVNLLNSEYVGICLDTVNSFGSLEGPEKVIMELAPYTINLHYKDFTINRLEYMLGFQIIGSPAGQGMLDSDMLRDVFKTKGNEFHVILEQWTPFTETVEKTMMKESQWAEESIKFLKKWLM